MCLFCNFKDDDRGRITYEEKLSYVIEQYNDKRVGAMLIVPRRHIKDLYELTQEEWISLYRCLHEAKKTQDLIYQPAGYNLGCNMYKCAGQDNEHVHMHLYPRYEDELYVGKGVGYWINSGENVRTK